MFSAPVSTPGGKFSRSESIISKQGEIRRVDYSITSMVDIGNLVGYSYFRCINMLLYVDNIIILVGTVSDGR